MPNPANSRPHIYMPDGSVHKVEDGLYDPSELAWVDKTVTFGEEGQQVSFTPAQILMAAARMQRDGRTLRSIYEELDLDPREVNMAQLETAIRNVGMPLLEKRIAAGLEPAESQIQVDKYTLPLNVTEED